MRKPKSPRGRAIRVGTSSERPPRPSAHAVTHYRRLGDVLDTESVDKVLILDRRHQDSPNIPLIKLSPTIPATEFVRKGSFPFVKLPGELRNKIYKLCIRSERYSPEWIGGNQKTSSLTYHLCRPTT